MEAMLNSAMEQLVKKMNDANGAAEAAQYAHAIQRIAEAIATLRSYPPAPVVGRAVAQ